MPDLRQLALAAIAESGGRSPRLALLLQTLAACSCQGGGNGVLYDLVFQPGNTGKLAPNAFTDLSVLAAAARQIPGQKLVTFDPSFIPGPMQIPAGAYDFRAPAGSGGKGADTVWRTDPVRFPGPVVNLADGVTLAGVGTFINVRVFSNNTTTPVITATAEETAWYVRGWSSIQPNGSQPFILDPIDRHNTILEVLDDGEILSGTGTAPFLQMAGALQAFTALTQGEAIINSDTLAGPVGNSYGGRIGQASGFISTAQIGLPGGVLAVTFGDQANTMQYDFTADAGFWAAPPPGTPQSAIHRLAKQVFALGGPIPL